jgi:L-lysine exporter family protein LysE/ArgO
VAALALSLLNPQAYFEMVALVGGIALRFPLPERMLFAIGVAIVSPLWFFGLVFGGRRLAGLFSWTPAQRALDVGVGLLMVTLAVAMISREVGW